MRRVETARAVAIAQRSGRGAAMTGMAVEVLRAHALGLAADLGVRVHEHPALALDVDNGFEPTAHGAARVVDTMPVTDVFTYYVLLHELGHFAMVALRAGCTELDQEHHAHAWARAVALVDPDERAAAEIAAAWRSYGGGARE